MTARPRLVLAACSVAIIALVVTTAAALAPDAMRPWLAISAGIALVTAVQSAASDPADLAPALLFSLPPVIALLADGSPTWLIGPLAALLLLAGELSALSWESNGTGPIGAVARHRLRSVAGLVSLAFVASLAVGMVGRAPSPRGMAAAVLATAALAALGHAVFRRPRVLGIVLPGIFFLSMLFTARGVEGQLPSPARDAVEELLDVVRTGDRARIRSLIEGRFTDEFIDSFPMEYHVPVLASLGRQVERLETTSVSLDGPSRASLILEGPGSRLELRLRVEPEPPHRIEYLGWGDAGPDLRAESLDDLGRELDRLANRPPFSGVVLVARETDVLFHEAYGTADIATGRPNRPDTRFDLGSINKLFTSTAILRLGQDGVLDLADPIGKYLDGFSTDVAERVTIHHLLRHRSGFGDYLSHPDFEADPARFSQPADFLPLARQQELAFEPGSRQDYSNMGFVLLGAVIESVTGRGYHDVVDELVFTPAGMASAGPRGGARAARRYELQHGRFTSTDSLYPGVGTPAGGGFASAPDLHHFIEALLDHRLLNASNTALLLNGFEVPAQGGPLPDEFGFAGGAPGVNAVILTRSAERHTVILLANMDPLAAEVLTRRIQGLVR